MKKLLLILFSLFLLSCSHPGVHNPNFDNQEVFVQVDSSIFKVVWVVVSRGGDGFYMLLPEDSKVSIPQIIGYQNGKTNTSIIKVK